MDIIIRTQGEGTVQKLLPSLLAMLLLTLAGFAQGQVVTYTFSGIGDGTVNGIGFTLQTYRFTVTAPAATVQNATYPYSNVLSGGTIAISGTVCAGGCTITAPGSYLVFNTGPGDFNIHGLSLVGELDVNGDTLLEGCWDCGAPTVNDNLVTKVAPTASGADDAEAPYYAFATSGGVVQITDLDSEITYSVATVSAAASPIPTLSRPGLILLGALLALGALLTLRRRRR